MCSDYCSSSGFTGPSSCVSPTATTQAVIELAAGALMIVVAVAVGSEHRPQWRPRHAGNGDAERPQRESLFERALGRHSVWVAWAAGAIYSLPGAEYLAGLVLLAKVGAPTASEVLAVLGFNVIMFAVIELPLLGFVLAPERTRSLTEKLNRWMTDHRRILIVIVTGAVGIYLLISGFGDLG